MGIIYVGSARHNEKKTATGGQPGDQLQKVKINDMDGEVAQEKFYIHRYGWDIIRAIDINKANVLSKKMITACDNPNLGYDQGSTRLGALKYGIESKVPTGCDCSSLVRAIVKETYGIDPGQFSTADEKKVLSKMVYENGDKLFNVIDFESLSKTPVYNGDILVSKKKAHTAIVTSGNPRVKNSSPSQNPEIIYFPKYNGKSYSIVDALIAVGSNDFTFAYRKKIAVKNGFKTYSGTREENLKLVSLIKAGKLIKP